MLRPHRDPPLPSLTRPALVAAIPSEASVWNVDVGTERRWRIGTWTLLAALLLHLLPLLFWLWQLWHWPTQSGMEEPAIEVTLVPELPKPVAPTPPANFKPRESGPDEVTEAKKAEKPIPAPPQPRSPEPPPQAKPSAIGLTPPKADPGPRQLAIHLPSRAGGDAERDRTGDPYLNSVLARISSKRIYPPASLLNGAPEKVAVFAIGIEPTGDIATITTRISSGSIQVDEVARQMILASRPLPPLPPDYPNMRVVIIIYVPIYPSRGG